MFPKSAFVAVVLILCLAGMVSPTKADSTHYFIQFHTDQPDDDPAAPTTPVLTAVVASIETDSDSEPSPPDPDSPGGPAFYELSLDSLEALGYAAPEEVLENAESEGEVESEELDGWGVAAYIWPRYVGSYLKRVKLGGKVWRDWYNPGPMSLQVKVWTTGISRESPWWTGWGWNKAIYYDFTYLKSVSYNWHARVRGSNTYSHETYTEKEAWLTW